VTGGGPNVRVHAGEDGEEFEERENLAGVANDLALDSVRGEEVLEMAEEGSGLLHLERFGFRVDSRDDVGRRGEDSFVRELVGVEGLEDLEVTSEESLGFDDVGRDRGDSEEFRGEGGRAVFGFSVDEEEEVDKTMEDLSEVLSWSRR